MRLFLLILLLSVTCNCCKSYVYDQQKIPCNCFTKELPSFWQQEDGYYLFKNDKWDKFYYIFTYGGQYCLEGMRQKRFVRLYGEPNEIIGDSLIYHMDGGCKERDHCNVQIFEFHEERLSKVHLIRPWGNIPISYNQ